MKQKLLFFVYSVLVSAMTLVIHEAREEVPPVVAATSQEDTDAVTGTIGMAEQRQEPEPMYVDGVALDHGLQGWLFEYCWNRNLSGCLVIAMIEQESECDPDCIYITDNEESYGLMQIQPFWHQERMYRLGVTDILDPKQNIRTGVDFLLELFEKNPETEWVLNAYNGGEAYADRMQEIGIVTDYSLEVLTRAKELEVKLYGDDE